MVQIPGAPRVGDLAEGGKPVDEAVYDIRLTKATYKLSKKTANGGGNPMVEAQFTIFGPDEAEAFHGRKVFDNLMLTGDGSFRLRQLLEATGENTDFVLEDTDQLIDRECKAVVQIEKERTENGVTYPSRNKIGRYLPLNGQ